MRRRRRRRKRWKREGKRGGRKGKGNERGGKWYRKTRGKGQKLEEMLQEGDRKIRKERYRKEEKRK